MAQFARPDGDVTNTGTNGFGAIDEATASDADFWYGDNNVAETLEVSLSNVTDPASSSGHIFRYRIAKTNAGTVDGAGNAVTVTVSLYQGATLIKADTAKTATGTWTGYTLTLSSTEADAISDYTDLRLRFVTSASGGSPSSRRGGAVSWAELEVPAVVTPTSTSVARVSLAGANTPAGRRDHSIKVRGRVQSGSVGTFRAALYEGSTNRSGDLETSTLTTSLADYTLPISDANAANITDYSDLEIRFWGYVASGTTPTFEVAEIYLELPDQISTELSPSGLDHSRALGTGPKVNPSLGPASLDHSRTLGGPAVSPKLGVASLTRTRALGAITVTVATNLSLAGLDHSKALGSPKVNPKLGLTGLTHTRALGSPNVVVLLEPVGLDHGRTLGVSNVVLILKPIGLDRTRGSAPAPQTNTAIPMTGLTHSRALGTTAVESMLGPGGLTRTRVQGSPQVNPQVVIASLDHGRALGAPTAQSANQIVVSGLAHSRALGSATVSPRVLPASLTHTRAIGSPLLGLGPASLTHTRALGSSPQINVTIYIATAYGGGPYGGGPYGIGSGGLEHDRALGAAGISSSGGGEYDQDNHFRLPHYYS